MVQVMLVVLTCFVVTTRTLPNRKRGTPQIVVAILAQDYPVVLTNQSPMIDLVTCRIGVDVSYVTVLREIRLAANEVRGSP